MKWRKRGTSADIEDRRGRSGRMGGLPAGGVIGIPGLIILALVFFLNRGGGSGGTGGLGNALDQINPGTTATATPLNGPDPDARLVKFMSYVLDDVQKFWTKTFADSGRSYTDAKLVLFKGSTSSGCGGATSAIGPHYCPVDNKVYLDLGFFRELRDRFGAPGDFAEAYVLAHEIGHHVQDLLGISDRVDQEMQAAGGGEGATGLSVASSCRLIALPACGPTPLTSETRSATGIFRRAYGRRRPSVTIACRNKRQGAWTARRGRTAHRPNGPGGSRPGSTAEARAAAKPSPRGVCSGALDQLKQRPFHPEYLLEPSVSQPRRWPPWISHDASPPLEGIS
jgi:predicted metalloprotease